MVKYTQKESAFLDRLAKDVNVINKNPNQSIGTLIEELAGKTPSNPAILFEDKSWTWLEFNEEINKIANYFLQLGLKEDEAIALMLRNSPEYLFIVGGINKIQGITGLINYNQKKKALIHSFNRVEPKFVIVEGESLPSFNQIFDELGIKNDQIYVINNLEDLPHDFIDLPGELKSVSKSNPETTHNSNLNQIAYYIFSSGTTGLPKAIKMVHKKLFTQGLFLGKSVAELTPDDVIYIATPLYHNIAIGQSWMAGLLSGAASAIAKRFSASEYWKDVKKFNATYAGYVGEMPRYLLSQPSKPEYEIDTPLRCMVGVGLRKEIWKQFRTRFKVAHVYEYYGLTEGHRAFMNVDEKPGMIGRYSMPGMILAKFNPEKGEFYKNEKGFHIKCKKPGDIGMALVKLDKVDFFARYKNEDLTRKKIMHDVLRSGDQYFNTGDLIQLHEEDWLSFFDRTGDTFRWKSENVSTLEVESILNSYPSIIMSCVYGVAIPNMEGKAGMAAIKLDPNLIFDLDKFSGFVQEVLPNYSIPVFVRISDQLELTGGTLKVIKFDLRKGGYDLEIVKDPLYIWNTSIKRYQPLDQSIYQKILEGKFKI